MVRDEFEQAIWAHEISGEVMRARDALLPIIEGEIDRGHCSPGERECYGGRPGKRKTMLADAKKIAKHVHFILNKLASKIHDDG